MGRSFGSFRDDLEAAVRRAYVATNAFVSVARVRQFSVLVSGEVNNPGQRLVTGLASVVDAILLSGGVKKSGSLRNVRLQRGGRQFPIDLYAVLTGRGTSPNLRLADGDRIIVPLLGETAAVAGLVRRPGIYELPSGQRSLSVGSLLELAGGQEVRGRYRMSLLRAQPDGRTSLTAVNGENGAIQSSDILIVQMGADQVVNQVMLGGASGLAGVSPVSGGSLSQWLREPGALGNSPYTLFGILVRKNPQTLARNLVAFTPVAVLAGREDITLQSEDFIRPLSANEAQLLTFVLQYYLRQLANAQAAIRNPLSQVQSAGAENRLNQLQAQSGRANMQLEEIASVPSDIQRREIIALLETPAPGSELLRWQQLQQQQQLQRQRAAVPVASGVQRFDPMTGAPLLANQGIDSSPVTLQDQGLPGEVTASSPSGPAANFINQVSTPGQFSSNREVETFGQLVRQLGVDPLILINFLVDNRVRLEGAVQGPGEYLVGPSATVPDLVQVAGGTVSWADDSGVELISTILDRQTGRSSTHRSNLAHAALASYTLRPRDQIRFGQIFSDVGLGSVTMQGEVRNPGNFTLVRGERLSDLLARAGGVTGTGYPAGTVFLRRSAADAEHESYQRIAGEVQNQLIVAMTRVGNDPADPGIFAAMQNFIVELRNQRALGRISVVADPSVLAANPGLDPLLEQGDVIYIPQRPSTISVLGQVLQPGSYPYRPNETLGDYIARAGGYGTLADESQTFVVLPDGSARRMERSWLSFGPSTVLPPGSAIVVPRDISPLNIRQTIIDISQIMGQLAVSVASLAVLARQ